MLELPGLGDVRTSIPVRISNSDSTLVLVQGFYFDEAARQCRPIEVEVERLPNERSCHRVPYMLTRPTHIQRA